MFQLRKAKWYELSQPQKDNMKLYKNIKKSIHPSETERMNRQQRRRNSDWNDRPSNLKAKCLTECWAVVKGEDSVAGTNLSFEKQAVLATHLYFCRQMTPWWEFLTVLKADGTANQRTTSLTIFSENALLIYTIQNLKYFIITLFLTKF